MAAHRIAILSARRCGAAALYRLLAPVVGRPGVGGQPFHWDHPWGDVSREFHEGAPERAGQLLDEYLASGALFHHHYDEESWDFNQMLLDALGRAGYRIVVIERPLDAGHLFSIIVSKRHPCPDAEAVARWRETLQQGAPVEPMAAQEVHRAVALHVATRQWFRRVLRECTAAFLVLDFERLFLRGVAGLEAVDELFLFAGLGARNAVFDDGSLLRFLWAGQHYTAGLAAYSTSLRSLYSEIAAALSSPSVPQGTSPDSPNA